MNRSRDIRNRLLRLTAAVSLCLPALSLPAAGSAGETGEGAVAKAGMAWENVRNLPEAELRSNAERVHRLLSDVRKGDLSDEEKGEADFLEAEILYALGDFGAAADRYRSFWKRDKKGPFADDALLAWITSLEAQGQDKDAQQEWTKWLKTYGDSPLRAEAELARARNALRRGAIVDARTYLESLREVYPWITEDARFTRTDAMVAFLQNRPQEALDLLSGDDDSDSAIYLRALAFDALGQGIKAAARYQELAERHPESPLFDYALFAKADVFLRSGAWQSAGEEYDRVMEQASRAEVRAEASLRRAWTSWMSGNQEEAVERMREVVNRQAGTSVAARAQFLLGDYLYTKGSYEEAIVEFNRLQAQYFDHSLAATALFRVGQCFDALGRQTEATSTYQAVVAGYPIASEAPASAYLAGVGLLEQNLPEKAAPYFQLVMDRYAKVDSSASTVFVSPEHLELVEASLCLLELAYHRSGNMGQLSGFPHLMLQNLPPSKSHWRAYAQLIDADALASQGRYEEAQQTLEPLTTDAQPRVGVAATRLLAWVHERQGNHELAIRTEEQMLERFGEQVTGEEMVTAQLNRAHILFNRQQYEEAALAYDDFAARFPDAPERILALYQSGICHLRLAHTGDAVDRWEEVVSLAPANEIAERAWVRAGDLYFQADHFQEARRCYQGLIDNFPGSAAVELGLLRLAQCEYNAGQDREALDVYSRIAAEYPGTETARQAEKGIEQALYRLGQGEKGTEVLAELIDRYPNSSFAADAQFEIATRSFEAGEYLDAADRFRRVVSQFPGYAAADRAQFFMAEAYREAGSTEEARMAYEQFVLFFPESELRPRVQFNLGTMRFAANDYMRAAIDFTGVLEGEAPPDLRAPALFNLALCQQMMGATDEARADFEQYRQENPADPRLAEVACRLGDLHEQQDRFEDAAREYQRGLDAKPSPELATELHYHLGFCREQMEKVTEAITAYDKAIKSRTASDPFRISALVRSAALHETRGEYDRAIVLYRDIAGNAKDPELVEAASRRADELKSIAQK